MKKISYEAPSNIALVKYWGKYGNQLPLNPSISFTLSHCKSIFNIELTEIKDPAKRVTLEFEGKENDHFIPKIVSLFSKIAHEYPIVNEYHWNIRSENTFPHSSGIASSASSMAALAMCIDELQYGYVDIQRASIVSRIGSGSASRSVIPRLGWWGHHLGMPLSSQEYAIDVSEDVDPIFHSYQNTILIAHSGQKSVSSSAGHKLMDGHVYSKKRFENAHQNIIELYGAMREGDLEKFGEIVEYEAMSLHALMMMSSPSFILMKPATLQMIDAIVQYRNETKLPIYYTLDAGPNIHLLYPENIKKEINSWLSQELKKYCEDGLYIQDQVGYGPKKIF